MNEEKEKLSSDKVPEKLTEWLLAMGCPAEKVPSLDSAKQMCRGQYYIVWRSLMDEVEPKDAIKYKRLTVFTEDMRKCKENNLFNESTQSVIVPDELSLWSQHNDVIKKVSDAETRLYQSKKDLQLIVDKVSSKLSQRNLVLHQLQDLERRVFLLKKYLEELQGKKVDLQETMTIANSLSSNEDNTDIDSKVDKCVNAMRRGATRPPPSSVSIMSGANPVACSSVASLNNDNDYEDLVSSVVKCRGDAVWRELYERRAGLCLALSSASARKPDHTQGVSAKSIVAQTAALHCNIALEAMKNNALIRQARKRLASAVTQLSDYLSGDACEFLVLNCERSRAQSRVEAMRKLLEQLKTRAGVFECAKIPAQRRNKRTIAALDKAIVSKKEEMRKSLQSLAAIERKILNVRDCLRAVFNCFQNNVKPTDMERFKGHIVLPQESITTLQQFYEERRMRQKKIELSLDMDISGNNSFMEQGDEENPKLIDELRIYLEKFNLEKNRKLILESGDKIWIFETLKSSIEHLHKKWLSEELPCNIICPSVSLATNLYALENSMNVKNELEFVLQSTDGSVKKHLEFDISSQITEENEATDKIKKRLNDNLITLQKVNRNLDLGAENLKFWAANEIKNYINCNRTMDGKTYREYEKYYLDCLRS